MKKSLGFVLGLFLASQCAIADEYTKSDTMEQATDQQSAEEKFEQVLEESPTASGLTEMKKNPEEMTEQAQEKLDNPGESDMQQEDPMTEQAEQ